MHFHYIDGQEFYRNLQFKAKTDISTSFLTHCPQYDLAHFTLGTETIEKSLI